MRTRSQDINKPIFAHFDENVSKCGYYLTPPNSQIEIVKNLCNTGITVELLLNYFVNLCWAAYNKLSNLINLRALMSKVFQQVCEYLLHHGYP